MRSTGCRTWALLATTVAVIGLPGCAFPKDAESSLIRARERDELRVGVVHQPPWVDTSGKVPVGVEATLATRYAISEELDVRWRAGSEAEVVSALEAGVIDIAIGNFHEDTPWREEVAVTRTYLETAIVVVDNTAENLGDIDIDGRIVGVSDADLGLSAVVVRHGGRLGASNDTTLTALHDWQSRALEKSGGVELETEGHVLLVRNGENALLSSVERFLEVQKPEVRAILDKAAEAEVK